MQRKKSLFTVLKHLDTSPRDRQTPLQVLIPNRVEKLPQEFKNRIFECDFFLIFHLLNTTTQRS